MNWADHPYYQICSVEATNLDFDIGKDNHYLRTRCSLYRGLILAR